LQAIIQTLFLKAPLDTAIIRLHTGEQKSGKSHQLGWELHRLWSLSSDLICCCMLTFDLSTGHPPPSMPGKSHKASSESTANDADDSALPFLPASVLSHIARFGLRSYRARDHYHWQAGHPLLGVSKACRDAVLHATKTISLLDNRSPSGPSAAQMFAAARLLHRACCEASPGLKVSLSMKSWGPYTLLLLLQPGISSGGWTKVHTLKVRL
jgi:hypothetical protein